MENLIFSLNATVPIFFTMILGFVFRKVGLMDEEFTNKANKFVFQAALPALLFSDLSQANFRDVWNGTFVAYCALTTMICIVISILISCLWKDKSIQGEFVQGAYRSSAAILGIAFIQNIYGTSGMAPLMIIASVPIYNVMAVVVLAFLKPERETGRNTDKEDFKRDCNQSDYSWNPCRGDLVRMQTSLSADSYQDSR